MLLIMTAETTEAGISIPVADLALICPPCHLHCRPDIFKIGLFQKGSRIGDGLVVYCSKIGAVAFLLQLFQILNDLCRSRLS